jgi:hypothetical protein
MKNPFYRVLVVLAAAGILAMLATSLPGCATVPPAPPAAPIGTDPPAQPAPPDPVAECRATIADMELAAGLAKVAAAFLVGSNSNYREALEAAIAALDAALLNASKQCESGSVDGWQVALAAFNGAMARIAANGVELSSNAIAPPFTATANKLGGIVFKSELVGTVDDVDSE